MTWRETLDYLYSALPMYQRIGSAAYKADLTNTHAICGLLNNPQHSFRSIHIAGTNGKGSTSHALAAIFSEAGYKTGLYTSPHLHDFRERIRINGHMISRQAVIHFTEKYKNDFGKIKPSFFEMTVGLAFDYFRQQKVDIAIIETGLGGRLDSTNVITPEFSLITNIGWDHMNLLGDTLKKIAEEKAGIIKPKVPVIISETDRDTKAVFIQKAKQTGSTIHFADQVIKVKSVRSVGLKGLQMDIVQKSKLRFSKLQLDLAGLYQVHNIKGILLGVDRARECGYKISDAVVRKALRNVTSLTGLRGRWQVLLRKPLTICDAGHNTHGLKEVIRQLKNTPHQNLHIVIGMVNDKEIDPILKLLPRKASYYFCQAAIPRALDAKLLADRAAVFHLKGIVIPVVKKALAEAQKRASKRDLVFVGGSTFVVGEVCQQGY